MEAYTEFAQVYDLFMDNVPYEEWHQYLTELLKEYGVSEGLVLELGCGTGKMTRLLADSGYDMIGVDNSEEMLEIAREMQYDTNSKAQEEILYLLQDMRSFELYGTVRAIVSVCDSMNYITEEQDFLTVLKLVNNYLDPGGIFIFDLNTVYKFQNEMGDRTISENREEGSFIWENLYDEESGINEYHLTLFIKEEGMEEELFRRYEEWHYERAYELDQVRQMIEEAGLEFVTAYDAFTKDPVKPESGRIYVIAREKTKKAEGKEE